MRRTTLPWLLLVVQVAAPQQEAELTRVDEAAPQPVRLLAVEPGPRLRVALPGGEAVSVPARRVVMLTLGRAPRPTGPLVFHLLGGDRLYGTLLAGGEEELRIGTALTEPVTLPLDRLVRLEARDLLASLAEPPELRPPEGMDLVLRRARRGVDRIAGTVERLTPEAITVTTALGELRVPFAETAAVVLGSPGPPPPDQGLTAVLLGADGSRLSGRLESGPGERLVVKTPHGFLASVPTGRVCALYFRGGDCVFLSDLEPAAVEERSYLPGLVWHYRRDRTTTGRPLRMGGRFFPKGLGVHSYCALTYRLDGRYRAFRAWIGVDDEVAQLEARGAVVYRVLVDGQEAYRSPLLRGGEAPRLLPEIPLTGKKRLTLIVDFGDASHVADRADWGLAYLIRAK